MSAHRCLRVETLPPGCGYGDAGAQYVAGLRGLGLQVIWSEEEKRTGGIARRLARALGIQRVGGDCEALLAHLPPAGGVPAARDAAPAGPRRYAYATWELGELLTGWAAQFETCARVFVPCAFNRDAFLRSGVAPPIDIVPHVARPVAPVGGPLPGADIGDDDFVFYTIGVWGARKAMEDTVRAYLEAFGAKDPVALVIKTDAVDHIAHQSLTVEQRAKDDLAPAGVWRALARIMADYPEPAKVHLVTRRVGQQEIDRLHTRGDCYVSLTRAEGWGLGAFDAALFGNPVVITGWSGHLDYLGTDHPLLVRYRLEKVSETAADGSYAAQPDALWARADRAHAGTLMRHAFERRDEARAMSRELKEKLARDLAPERVCRRLADLMGFEMG